LDDGLDNLVRSCVLSRGLGRPGFRASSFAVRHRLMGLPVDAILALMGFKKRWMIAAIPVTTYVAYVFVVWLAVTALHSGASPLTVTARLVATYAIIVGIGATFVGAQLGPKMRNGR
jgi:hypothetical protein